MTTEYTQNEIAKAAALHKFTKYEEFDLVLKMNIESQLDGIRLCLIDLNRVLKDRP